MTNLEAQNALANLKRYMSGGGAVDKVANKAIDIAIEALDAQLCEDTVSRKDCLQALSHLMDIEGFRDGWAVSRANVKCMLKAMPPVTPKQRTGEWIRDGHHIRCNRCGTYMCDTDREGDRIPTNFCPNCGAKMEGVNK